MTEKLEERKTIREEGFQCRSLPNLVELSILLIINVNINAFLLLIGVVSKTRQNIPFLYKHFLFV